MIWIVYILGGTAVLFILLAAVVWALTFHPKPQQPEAIICRGEAPLLQPGQLLKVLCYNVQYMAGKNYIFFYDVPGQEGPHSRPSREDITRTIGEVARVLREEDPDIILLQEVNDGARRTDYEDQLARLLPLLPDHYMCHTQAFYWKARYVPHKHINGAVGMKLVVLSKYRIDKAIRHQLPLMPKDPLTRQFILKRAILETHLPMSNGQTLTVLNTHFDTWARGSNTMHKQVAMVDGILSRLEAEGVPWLIGGDFNLLPPGDQFKQIPDYHQAEYEPETELALLYQKYPAIPALPDLSGPDAAKWLTHFPNDPRVSGPVITLDYIFYSRLLALQHAAVRHHDTLHISDHLPVVGHFRLPNKT